MRRVVIKCGCGATVGTKEFDDGKDFTTVIYDGECAICSANGGNYWKNWRFEK